MIKESRICTIVQSKKIHLSTCLYHSVHAVHAVVSVSNNDESQVGCHHCSGLVQSSEY